MAATAPVAKFERSVAPQDQDVAVVVANVTLSEELPEICVVRYVLCVGPFEPQIDVFKGTLGVRATTNDSNLTVGHDPARTVEYGPYAVPTITDDIRICWSGCRLPDSLYASLRTNATFYVYVLHGQQAYAVQVDENVSSVHSPLIPRSWCRYAQNSPC